METETTSVSVSTRLPTYWSVRITLGHEHVDRLCTLIRHYSSDWCMVAHNPDNDEHNPHFHLVVLDFLSEPKKKVMAFVKRLKETFQLGGNGGYSGKWRTNDVMEALTYFSHDPVFYKYYPDSWDTRIKAAPAWKENGQSSRFTRGRPRERLGDPTLTFSSVLKQALKYRHAHQMDTSSLTNVLSRMVNEGGWIPSRELLTNGVPRELHELFECRVTKRKWDPDWMYPHVRSDRKQEWLDRPDRRAKIIHDPNPIQYISHE